jgi:inward rectifier potassium channel
MAQSQESEVVVLGATSGNTFRDFYHAFLSASWPRALGAIVIGFLVLNAVFATLFLVVGGVAHTVPGSFADAFFFSVQTMCTIGYGDKYPTTLAANVLVVAEAVTGLVVTATATGLVFAKVSLSSARVAFMNVVTVGAMDGVPTLMFRVGNQRANLIVEAQVRVVLVRTDITKEGHTFYRMIDLKLVRERSSAFTRSWTIMHTIDETSPLFGVDAEAFRAKEMELVVTIVGVDETSLQPVHARHRYTDKDVVFGARPADILSEEPSGRVVLDLRKFHDVERMELPGVSPPA